MSAVKQLEIKATTIQELAQNDLMLVNSALQSSAKSISDMYNDLNIYTDDGKSISGKHWFDSIENGAKYTINKGIPNWNKNAWFINPTKQDVTKLFGAERDAAKLCGLA